ncbi:unnamed protein product [Meloidogyne enterolobii]|uniref:Uncharacterized protein n=1 Tax=Meloidogyne enterolobii TaxID=390850 RepID=A0ACB0YQJ5_MELEN
MMRQGLKMQRQLCLEREGMGKKFLCKNFKISQKFFSGATKTAAAPDAKESSVEDKEGRGGGAKTAISGDDTTGETKTDEEKKENEEEKKEGKEEAAEGEEGSEE